MPQRNEGGFVVSDALRAANEHMGEWPERIEAPARERLPFFCECGHPKCREQMSLTKAEYDAVRTGPTRFAVLPGHELQCADRVLEVHDEYVVIEKHEDSAPSAEQTA
jgi:hypothetical protein